MLEAFQHKFNKPIENDITIYNTYVMYCKYANNNGKLMTVSKKYYYKYIGKSYTQSIHYKWPYIIKLLE